MNIGRILIMAFVLISLAIPANASPYRRALRGASKKANLYDPMNMEAKMIWNATFFSQKFRDEYTKRNIKLRRMPPLQAAQYVADQQYKQEKGWTFFLSMFTEKDYRQFNMDQDSFWKIRLIVDGEEYAPISIERLPKTPLYKELFPYITRWSYLFRVVFPKVDLKKRISLSVFSVVGQSTLKWKMPK